MNQMRVSKVLKPGLIIFNLILVVTAISHIEYFQPNWPFALFASFLPSLIIITPFMLILAYFIWRVEFYSLLFWSGLALFPFITFDKYVTPDAVPCAENCISIISANLHHDLTALDRLAKMDNTNSIDLIIVQDIPSEVSADDLSRTYPNHGFIQYFDRTELGERLGNAMAVISKTDIPPATKFEVNSEGSKYAPRIFLKLSYPLSSGEAVSIFVLHPMMPVTRDRMKFRDRMLNQVKSEIGDGHNFILIGDFNMTPWEPKFEDIPGRRVGSPKWISTWDATKPGLRLVIDHIMIGEDWDGVESEVLPDIGSDHYPVRAVVRYGGGAG